MLCVHESQVEHLTRDITRQTRYADLIGDNQLPLSQSEFQVAEVSRHFGIAESAIVYRMDQLAPKSSRLVQNDGRNRKFVPHFRVYPRAAIEAALRGEHWQPPADAPATPAPAAGRMEGTVGEDGGTSNRRKKERSTDGEESLRVLRIIDAYSGNPKAKEIAKELGYVNTPGHLNDIITDLKRRGLIQNNGKRGMGASGFWLTAEAKPLI